MPNLQNQIGEVSYTQKSDGGYFVQVPVALVKSDLSSSALRLYLLLLAYSGARSSAWPGQARLATDLGLSERRVRSLLDELVAAELVEVEHIAGTTNLYHLRKPGSTSERKNNTAASPVKKFRIERNNSSAELHAANQKHVCNDAPAPEISQENKQMDHDPIAVELAKAGLAPILAAETAKVAIKNGHDLDYAKKLVEASQEKSVYNPAGFVRFMVLRNADIPVKTERTHVRFTQKSPKTSRPTNNPPLDFAKYTTGKYAFLNARRKNTPADDVTVIPPEVKANIQPDYQRLRRSIALAYQLDPAESTANWENLLAKLGDSPIIAYFQPALGWVEAAKGRFNLVFRNDFDRQKGERYLPLLRGKLRDIYGVDLMLECCGLHGQGNT